MARRPVWILSGITLVVGFVIGAASSSLPFVQNVHARSGGEFLDRAYEDLQRHNPLAAGGRQLHEVASLVTPSVVHIRSERPGPRGHMLEETGSGVIVEGGQHPGRYVVTNRHVVAGARLRDVSIGLHDGRELVPLRVWTDPATDVAVLKIEAEELQPARWADSDDVHIGHLVLAMGSPFGLSQSVTLGIVSAKGRRALRLGDDTPVLNQDFLQTDAAINPGNSGGPLVDVQGRVVGINTAIASNSGGNDGIGFSIPSNLVRRVFDDLLSHGKVQRAYLGVKLDADFDRATARRLKLDRARGARIVEVYSSTPASRANLAFDDVVLSFNGIDVKDENHLINLVSLTAVDERVKLVVFRDGRRITVEVVLADRAELERMSEAPARPGMGELIQPMGLVLHPLEADVARQLGLDESTRGLLVLRVEADASLAGRIGVYDVIEEVGATGVSTVEDVHRVLRRAREGDDLLLKVRRRVNGRIQQRVLVWNR